MFLKQSCSFGSQLPPGVYRIFPPWSPLQLSFSFPPDSDFIRIAWPQYASIRPTPKTGELDSQILTNYKSATAETNDPQIYLNLLWSTLSLLSTIKNSFISMVSLYSALKKNLLRLWCKVYLRICKCIGYGLISIKSTTKVGFKRKRFMILKQKSIHVYVHLYMCVYIYNI